PPSNRVGEPETYVRIHQSRSDGRGRPRTGLREPSGLRDGIVAPTLRGPDVAPEPAPSRGSAGPKLHAGGARDGDEIRRLANDVAQGAARPQRRAGSARPGRRA